MCRHIFKMTPHDICLWWFSADMRKDVQEIFKMTPHDKQVMMFSATLSKEIRPVCKKFMQDVICCHQYFLNFESFRSYRLLILIISGLPQFPSVMPGESRHGSSDK